MVKEYEQEIKTVAWTKVVAVEAMRSSWILNIF